MEVSKEDFERKRNASIATLILDYEDVENVNMKIQEDIINNGGIVTNLKDILEKLNMDDLNNIINLITTENTSINVFLPKENQE